MALATPAQSITTLSTPGSSATSRQRPSVLRKNRSLVVPLPPPLISRRHSWTLSRALGSHEPLPLNSSVMEVSEISKPLTSCGLPQTAKSLLSNRRAFSTKRTGTTFDMAYFLRHTGPPATATTAPAHEIAKDDSRRAVLKKNRGGIFRKRWESPDLVTTAAPEEQGQATFVPPEGVEQKVTARGMEYSCFCCLVMHVH